MAKATQHVPTCGRWLDVTVDGRSMPCYVAVPDRESAPGVLVCMHGPGVDEFITVICERLAAAGFGAIAPDLYYRHQMEPAASPVEAAARLVDAEVLADLAAASDALKALPGIDAQRFGVIGFCMGGRLSFLQATHDPYLRSAVVFYGYGITNARGNGPSPLERARGIRAPILGVFGADDHKVTAQEVAAITSELERLGKAHEFHFYEGAGHAFLHFLRPDAFHETAAEDAWARCLDWLTRHL